MRFTAAAFVVEHLLQLRAVEHRVFVALVEGDGTVGAGAGAELAEHAGAEVILVLHEAFLLFAVFRVFYLVDIFVTFINFGDFSAALFKEFFNELNTAHIVVAYIIRNE